MRGAFAVWLTAATVSAVGDGVLYFAVTWTATGISAALGGLVLSLGVLPRTLLMLVGGAVGDRWGLRSTLVVGHVVMCAVLVVFLGLDATPVPRAVLLVGLVLADGIVTSFTLPASGALPRLFVAPDSLVRAMSLVGSLLQVARVVGPPLGGVVVMAFSITGSAVVGLVGFAGVALVLALVRPAYEAAPPPPEGSTAVRVLEALRAAVRVPATVPVLAAVALVAGSLIPMLGLLIPLAARQRGWTAGQTGLVETAWVLGSLSVSLIVARRGTVRRPVLALVGGPVVAALGVLVVGVSRPAPVALAGAAVMGVGTAAFTSHAFPAYLLSTPPTMLARFQALLGVVQAGSVLVASPLLALVAARAGATVALLAVAVACALAAGVALSSREVRALDLRTRPA